MQELADMQKILTLWDGSDDTFNSQQLQEIWHGDWAGDLDHVFNKAGLSEISLTVAGSPKLTTLVDVGPRRMQITRKGRGKDAVVVYTCRPATSKRENNEDTWVRWYSATTVINCIFLQRIYDRSRKEYKSSLLMTFKRGEEVDTREVIAEPYGMDVMLEVLRATLDVLSTRRPAEVAE